MLVYASCISEYGTNNFKRWFEKLKQFTNLIRDRKYFLIVEKADEANNESLPLLIADGNKQVNRGSWCSSWWKCWRTSEHYIWRKYWPGSKYKNNMEHEVIGGLNIDQNMSFSLTENTHQEVQTVNENIRRKGIDEEK